MLRETRKRKIAFSMPRCGFRDKGPCVPRRGELASVRGLKNLKTEDKLEQILCPESKETIPLNNRTRLLDAVLFIPGQGLSVCFQGKVTPSPLDAAPRPRGGIPSSTPQERSRTPFENPGPWHYKAGRQPHV